MQATTVVWYALFAIPHSHEGHVLAPTHLRSGSKESVHRMDE
jgi:hypothetical protein